MAQTSPGSKPQDRGEVDNDTAMVLALKAMISELRTFRQRLEEGLVSNRRRSRVNLTLLIGIAIYVILSTSSLGYLLVSGNSQRSRVQQVVDEVHSAVTPGEPIYENGQKRQAEVLVLIESEEECRIRTALAGLPPAGQRSCIQLHPEFVN